MKLLYFIFLLISFNCTGQDVVNGVLPLGLSDTLIGTIRAVTSTGSEANFQAGTVVYSSSAYSRVKIVANWMDERQFIIVGLKPGKSTISIKLTRTDGKILSKTLVVSVVADEKKQANGFIMNLISK